MTALKRLISLALASAGLVFLLSCANGKPPDVILPLNISSAALPVAVINVPYSATLAATGGMKPYTWSVASGTLPAGLSLTADGTISGTPTALGNTTFKVQVSDAQAPTAAVNTAPKTITVNQPLAVSTTSLTSGSVGVPYSASLAATGGVPPYSWTITSGTLPAGLSLSTSGFISGTPTTEETQAFSVQVSDSQTTPTTASASLTLTINGPTSRLNGNYILSFSGYQNGILVEQAGSFTADGQGNITNGLMDSNSSSGAHTNLTFSGTYSLDATNTGPMTLNIANLGTFSYQLAVPATGTIRLIQNGTAGNQGTGYVRKVASTTQVTISQLAAYWVYGATGADSGSNRYARVGTFQADSSGNWTSVESDSNDNGTVTHNTSASGQFVAIDPVTGRGTATMTLNSVTTNYSFYPVSNTELVMLAIDPVSSNAPLALFTLLRRPINNYTNASISVATVSQLQGLGTSNSNTVPYALLGITKFDGNGGVAITTDENLGGTMSANSYPNATYSMASNGRATITGFGGSSVVLYLSQAVGFLLGSDSGVAYGTLLPQIASPYSNSSISGSYQGGTLQTVEPTMVVEADSAAADGAGNLALTYDTSGPGGPQQGLILNTTYTVDSTSGRAPLIANGNTVGIAYVVSSSSTTQISGKILVLSTDASARVSDQEK